MLGELIRVRIDAVHVPSRASRAHADVALPTGVAVAALLPDILRIFDIDVADFPMAQWQLRTATGRVLHADDTLAETNIYPGERLEVINDPGPVPMPKIFDAADAITDTTYTDGIGVADLLVGCVAALAATIAVAAASLSLSDTDAILGAAVSFIALLAIAGGLRLALTRQARTAIVLTLQIQLLILTVSTTLGFVGLELSRTLAEWPPTAAIATGLAVVGLALTLVGTTSRVTATVGAASLASAVTVGSYSGALAFFRDPTQAAAIAVAVAVLAILLAPAIAIKGAGIRVPRVPAAGESFDDAIAPEIPSHAPRRAGWLLDGILVAGATALGSFTLLALLSGQPGSPWPLALAAAVIVFGFIHSRGQARKVASTAAALAGLAVAVTIGIQQWFQGNWPVSATIVVPLLAATALAAFPATRISPTTRRIAELTEACSIAAIMPLVAIIADLPEFVSGVFQ